jgi:1,4-dihydroxy-2-naphthoate octaprenyltransferase
MKIPTFTALKILRVIRLHIIVGGVLAFSIGTLLAIIQGGVFRFEIVVFGYATVFFGDLSSHFSNDYYDVEIDKHTEKRKFFGGSKTLVENPNLRLLSRNISISLLIFSNLIAAISFFFLDAPIELFIIMFIANLIGWFYSAPPVRLISRGLGELAVAWVTGFVIPGVGYLSVRNQFDASFLCLSIPFMMYGFILSLSLHAPDATLDEKSGKNTLIVRKGTQQILKIILIVSTLASLTLFSYYYLFQHFGLLDLRAVFAISIVTLAIISYGFIKYEKNKQLITFANLNIASLFLFNMLLVAYLISLVL